MSLLTKSLVNSPLKPMRTDPQPDHWFRDVKKIYVIETVDYYTRRGHTKIVLCYKSWWKFRRTLRFERTRTTRSGAELHERCPEATAIIAKVKAILNPTMKRSLPEQESTAATLKSVLPVFADTPRFWGWPTAK
jgi:hypothetical protein